MPAGTKIKSVSVEDLGNIVKQMVNGALENTAQIAKLHQAVYEEWYFKKLAQLKRLKSGETREDLNEDVEQSSSMQACTEQKVSLCENKRFFPSNISIRFPTKSKSIELKTKSQTFNNITMHIKFNSLILLRDPSISAEITKTPSNATKFQDIGVSTDAQPNVHFSDGPNMKVIEVWNNNAQKTKSTKVVKRNPARVEPEAQRRKTLDNKTKDKDQANNKNSLGFEAWKKQKNIQYRQALRQAQKEKQEQLQAKLVELEARRAAQMYIRMRQQQAMQQKRKLTKEARNAELTNLKMSQKQLEMRRMINEKVFKEWKKQKDIKLREERMRINAYQQYMNNLYQQQQQQRPEHAELLHGVDTKFNSWLNQLDWVLHEKYLRERRYLVRSFYCQPAYYGNAADMVYAKPM